MNYGVMISPAEDLSETISFRSDEFTGYSPTLVIHYSGKPITVTPTPTMAPDTIPCRLTYAVSPENPVTGGQITITVTATDNQALSYVRIFRGTNLLASAEADGPNQTELSVTFTEKATVPGNNYTLEADDVGSSLPVRQDISVPVTGSGPPVVDIQIEWLEVERVVPEKYRLIEGDGQVAMITATAWDPDGLDYFDVVVNNVPRTFRYDGIVTEASETVYWENTDRNTEEFSCWANATDNENLYAATETYRVEIARMEDIKMYWSSATQFPTTPNPSYARLSWDRMVQVFGRDECWVSERMGWKKLRALAFYHGRFKEIADGGCCYGLSTMATEFYNGRTSPGSLEAGSLAHELRSGNSYTQEYVQARQASQLGESSFTSMVSQYAGSDRDDAGFRVLEQVERDLILDDPGIISIREGDGGHAVVPWMTRRMHNGDIFIYIYDCNVTSGIRNIEGDLSAHSQFPRISIASSGFSYRWGDGTIWNDRILYRPYSEVLGNPSENRLGGAGAPTVTDHTIPTLWDVVGAFLVGSADMYFEDEQGRVTGLKNGVLLEEIPGSMCVPVESGDYTDQEMVLLPGDIDLKANITGNSDDEYYLGVFHGDTVYTVEDKTILKNLKDVLTLEQDDSSRYKKLSLQTGSGDDQFAIRMGFDPETDAQKARKSYIEREIHFENVKMPENGKVQFRLGNTGDDVSVQVESGVLSFDVLVRSSESLEQLNETDTSVPGSRRVRLQQNSDDGAVTYAPESWETTQPDGDIIIADSQGQSYTEEYLLEEGTASSWAIPEILEAAEEGLITDAIMNNFTRNITRQEFCEISVKLYEKLAGKEAEPVPVNPFTDTSNAEILKAYNVGIVKGVSADRFAPDLPITRQEICVMLQRALKAALPSLNANASQEFAFDDRDQIAAWAIDAVKFMYENGVMKGVGNNRIAPLGNTTREQAIVLVKRTREVFR